MIEWRAATVVPFEFTASYEATASGQTTSNESINQVTGDIGFIGTFSWSDETQTNEGSTSNLTSSSSLSRSFYTANENGATSSYFSSSVSFLSISESSSITVASTVSEWYVSNSSTVSSLATRSSFSDSGEYSTVESVTAELAESFVEPATHFVTTSTTATVEREASTTAAGTGTHTFYTTATISTETTESGTATTTSLETSATSSTTASTRVHVSTTSEATVLTTSELSETAQGNAFKTFYSADSTEVVYAATSRVALSQWDGNGIAVSWASSASIAPEAITLPVVVVDGSAAVQSVAAPAQSSSLSWLTTTEVPTTVTSASIYGLPHTTSVVAVNTVATTTSSRAWNVGSSQVYYLGGTYAQTIQADRTSTGVRWLGALSHHTTFTLPTFYTQPAPGFYATSMTSGSSNSTAGAGETVAGGGNSTLESADPMLGVRTRTQAPEWEVYGSVGASGGSQLGQYYPFTGDITFISQAFLGRGSGENPNARRVTIFPATTPRYTADATGLTWRPFSTGDSATVTSSAVISAEGSGAVSRLATRTGLVGGALAAGETAAQRASRAVYRDQSGSTTWVRDIGDSTYVSSNTSAARWWAPVPYLDVFGEPAVAVPRNITSLPDFLPQASTATIIYDL